MTFEEVAREIDWGKIGRMKVKEIAKMFYSYGLNEGQMIFTRHFFLSDYREYNPKEWANKFMDDHLKKTKEKKSSSCVPGSLLYFEPHADIIKEFQAAIKKSLSDGNVDNSMKLTMALERYVGAVKGMKE